MKIKVDIKIFLILALYIIIKKKQILLFTIIFILLHELGHIIVGLLLGLKISTIKFNIAGISIEFKNYGEKRELNKILVIVAGPIVNLIIFIIGILLKQELIIYINLVLFILNMLPIYPLDGGRVLKTILLNKINYKRTIKAIEKISKNMLIILSLISSINILIFKNISIFILVVYLWGLFIKEHNKNKLISRVYKTIENNS